MMKILHFADAHIDMTNYGRHDPETGLPLRVMDFLRSLDVIVEAAIEEQVDLVLFAGDTYKDRNPAPTFQREWGQRIMRLSHAGIPTILLVGNHDISPALGRAHALDAFDTLSVPNVCVLDRPVFLGPEDIFGLPMQLIAIPWISRSGLMAHLDIRAADAIEIYEALEIRLRELIETWLERADKNLPIVLTAHASVQGAIYGGERVVMLGRDLVLPGSLVKDSRFSYVALGHIHKAQNLNEGHQPPVIYPGSIERVDFGEAEDEKFFVMAHVEQGKETQVEWHKLDHIRPFVDRYLCLESPEKVNEQLQTSLGDPSELEGAIVRLILEYPRDWEAQIDDAMLRELAAEAMEFHLIKRPQAETRVRLPEDQNISSLTPLDLLDLYWRATHSDPQEIEILKGMAGEVITAGEGEG
ncbi:MAG: exonuclease SbcCD subunit D [Chloroflexota bacterium]